MADDRPSSDHHVESDRARDVSVIKPIGTLTIGGGDVALREAVMGALGEGAKAIAVDLSETPRVDSSGIGELVSSYTTATNSGSRLTLSGLPPAVTDVLQLTQLIAVFDIFESRGEAVRDALGLAEGFPLDDPELARLAGLADAPNPALDVGIAERDVNLVQPVISLEGHQLIERLAREPASVHELSPRRFEEVVADLLADLGWDVTLTPATRDGGRDAIAVIPTEIGRLLCIVEVKRYREDRKVGIAPVRQLYGTVTHEDASHGLLVTSSSFSRPACDFAQEHQYRIGLKDYSDVVGMMRRYARSLNSA